MPYYMCDLREGIGSPLGNGVAKLCGVQDTSHDAGKFNSPTRLSLCDLGGDTMTRALERSNPRGALHSPGAGPRVAAPISTIHDTARSRPVRRWPASDLRPDTDN